MEKCANHPEREAVGSCALCGKPICRECVAETREDKIYCYECAVKLAALDYTTKEETQQERIKRKEKAIEERKKWAWVRKVAMIACIIALVEVTTISTAYYMNSRNKNASVRITDEMISRMGIDRCVIAMNTVYKQLQAYAKKHEGRHPEQLSELISPEFRKIPLCPVSDKPFIYRLTSDGKGFILSCPDPVAHGLEGLYFTEKGGPFLKSEEGE